MPRDGFAGVPPGRSPYVTSASDKLVTKMPRD
ncbi:rCG21470 [Rattus norvegicus]|uniref:RCG21470 n=1 Tax=Rattus norvegicus TaxID=10116 RepID=A6J1M9_RAT|nr:rCG21470 [Rattus norvegicus]